MRVLVPCVPPLPGAGVHGLLAVVAGEDGGVDLRGVHPGLVELEAGHVGSHVAAELARRGDQLGNIWSVWS